MENKKETSESTAQTKFFADTNVSMKSDRLVNDTQTLADGK